ncbi:E3 ubiquitin-protein ligase PUB24-like isoform X2 [Bidens hawaiensis]|uniref:E3 ubiquitin-protein ligase PUB24-like isoform X2 n=1 Tax=Bidens hawaiensis TaxID=980011 RepID=UPI00404B104B
MDDREIPHHFICPISLQIMKDPVTVATGITYDRDSIQRWQSHFQNKTCPVTNQLLPIDSGFTPNHNLRRLIQSWNESDQVPSSKESSFEIKNCKINGLKEALNVLYLVRFTQEDTHSILSKHDRIISSLTWVLDLDACDGICATMKFHAMVLLKDIIQHAESHILERLNQEFFKTIVLILQHQKSNIMKHGINEVLHVMLSTCTWPRNCSLMIDSGAVFELIEVELRSPEKAVTELIMAVLFHLCSSADGRAQLLGHAAGIATITIQIGKVSQKVDEIALMIISLISKFSGTDGVLQEMVRVGTVKKLCTVLQVYGLNTYTRDTARGILKRHLNVWNGSPCLHATSLACLQ